MSETMSEIRKEAVEKARERGICTQCLKHPVAEGMMQCERCIETNRRKQENRKIKRDRENLCSRCGIAPRFNGRTKCESCLEKDRTTWNKRYHAKKARMKAFAAKDIQPKRPYVRKEIKLTPMQMQGMIFELETFIGRLNKMTASEYLDARENLIKSIILRGRNTDGN